MASDVIQYHDVHVPDEVRVFTVPRAAVRRLDHEVFVYDVRIGHGVLRHYAFTDRWFAINCSLDDEGHFIREPGPFPWTFNCDIATPLAWHNGAAYQLDLALDVLVAANGRDHVVTDGEDFATAVARGWFTTAEQAGARRGLADLLGIITGDGLVPFLTAIHPFGPVADAPFQPETVHRRTADLPLLHFAARPPGTMTPRRARSTRAAGAPPRSARAARD